MLSSDDVALYRQVFSAERKGEISKADRLLAKISDPSLEGYAEAAHLLSARHVTIEELDGLAFPLSRSFHCRPHLSPGGRGIRPRTSAAITRSIRVAVVTDIPAPTEVGRRSGGYEDEEPPEPVPSGAAGRAALPSDPGRHQGRQTRCGAWRSCKHVQDSGSDAPDDAAILAHRIAASYLAEGMDAEAFGLATSIANTDPVPAAGMGCGLLPPIAWASGPTPRAHLEKLARNRRVPGPMRAQAAFWAARAHMQAGDPQTGGEPADGGRQARTQLLRPDRRAHAGHGQRTPASPIPCSPEPTLTS